MGALQVRSPDVGSQAVLGVVCQLKCFFVGIEWGNGNDWTEDFFLEDACRWIHVDKHGWLHEVALWEFCRALATGGQLGFLLADLDVGGDLLVVLWVDQCTNFGGWIGRKANLDALSLSCVALDELVVDAALDQDAGTSGATLAVKGEYTEDGGIDSCVQVGIVEDDRRGLAAEFHRQALEVRRCVAENDLAGAGFAGERNQWHVWVLDQWVTSVAFFAEAVDQVEYALWQASFLKDASPQLSGQRSELCWLEHNGVTGSQSRCKLPGLQHERRVPWGNQTRDADWLAVNVVDLAAWHLVGIIGLRDNQVREETEVFRGTLCLASGLGDGQTGVEGLPGCENLSAGFHDVCNLVQHAGTLTGKHGGPRAVLKGIVSRSYCLVDVCWLTGSCLDVGLVGDWVDDIELITVDGWDEFTIDVVKDLLWQILWLCCIVVSHCALLVLRDDFRNLNVGGRSLRLSGGGCGLGIRCRNLLPGLR